MKQMILLFFAGAVAGPTCLAQSAVNGPLGDFGGGQSAAAWGIPTPSSHKQGERDNDSEEPQEEKGEPNEPEDQGDPGHSNGAGRGGQGPYSGSPNNQDEGDGDGQSQREHEPLDPSDRQYDPTDMPDLNSPRIPSSCAEEGAACRQCMLAADANIQFNRRYLHIAWSIANSHIVYANRMMAIGDTGANMQGLAGGVGGLSWQLAGKPQIVSAVRDLRNTYTKKYTAYMTNIRRSVENLNACEQGNSAAQDLYRRFSSLYVDMLELRYSSPDP